MCVFLKARLCCFCLLQDFADRFRLNLFDSFLHLSRYRARPVRAPASPTTLMMASITPSSIATSILISWWTVLGFNLVHAPRLLNPCAYKTRGTCTNPPRNLTSLPRASLLATEDELFKKSQFRISPGLQLAAGPCGVQILRKCERMIRCAVHEDDRTVVLDWMAKCNFRILRRHAIYAPIKAKL